jgi:hypothetical protein
VETGIMDRGTTSLEVGALAVVHQAVALVVLAEEALVAEVLVAHGDFFSSKII